ncbi:MAG: AraC family transcriptional regulator [Tunicatimonas sp.]|uniref:helix-turn-helix domain-containing protein n=1 Tax=Tunicatimonas sp. TaxID=1940096 RepID=UPI003C786E4D
MANGLPNYQLQQDQQAAPFSLRTMEATDQAHQGQPDQPHRHFYYTILWPFNATGTHMIDFVNYEIKPDHIFFISPGQVHQVRTNAQPTGVVLLFTPDFLQMNGIREEFIDQLKIFRTCEENPPLAVSKPLRGTLQLYVEQMQQAQQLLDYRYEALGAWLKLFLIACNNACDLALADPQQLQAGQTILRQFKQLVESHITEWHKVNEYAEQLFITPNHLNDVVRSLLGQTAKEYIQRRLTLEAKRRAAFEAITTKELAHNLGFRDPSHFTKFFRAQTGQSLSEFKATQFR